MYSYLTNINDKTILCANNKLICVEDNSVLIENKVDFVYLYKNYAIDKEKNLFKITFTNKLTLEPIKKLKRGITTLILNKNQHEDICYIADRFGCVYSIYNNEFHQLLSNFCYTTNMLIKDNQILTCDKYGRIRISNLDGKILKYLFLTDLPLISMILISDFIIVCGSFNKLFIVNFKTHEITDYGIESHGNKLYKISKKEFMCLQKTSAIKYTIEKGRLHKISEYRGENFIDCVYLIKGVYLLNESGDIFLNDKKVLSTYQKYETFFNHLNHD